MIAMISGHLDLTPEEFWLHYGKEIDRAYQRGDSFVIGDARGADLMAQSLLFVLGYLEANVTIYCSAGFEGPRHNVGHWPVIEIGTRPYEKDRAMTAASDYDIAWVRPGKEKSGTAANINRRAKGLKDNA